MVHAAIVCVYAHRRKWANRGSPLPWHEIEDFAHGHDPWPVEELAKDEQIAIAGNKDVDAVRLGIGKQVIITSVPEYRRKWSMQPPPAPARRETGCH